MVGFGADQRNNSVADIIGLTLLIWLCKEVSGLSRKVGIANTFARCSFCCLTILCKIPNVSRWKVSCSVLMLGRLQRLPHEAGLQLRLVTGLGENASVTTVPGFVDLWPLSAL